MKRFNNKRSNDTKPINILNTPYLVIVESPSKCLKIEKYLGFQYKCIASKGHLREITKVMSAKHKYNPVFHVISEKLSHVEWMKSIVAQFEPKNIFIGTDDDREGEGIAWHICEVCNLDVTTTHRILFHEITESALKYAVNNPTFIRMNIVKAQQARQILDRMIGFKISPILSRLLVHDNSKFLSAGRCQTPTLRLIYDKYQEYLHKKSCVQYKITGTFFRNPSILSMTLDTYLNAESEVKDFLNNSKNYSHTLSIEDKKQKSSAAPKPFNTSNLLQTSSSLLHISPKHTMDICQKLYQDGKITYMRTESKKFAQAFVQQLNTYIANVYDECYIGDNNKITNYDNQNPHEAIRVTNLNTSITDYSDKKTNDVYRLIWKRTIESAMKDYEYEDYPIQISAPVSLYKSSLEIPIFLGWKRVTTTIESMQNEQKQKSMDISFYKNYLGKNIPYQKIEACLFVKDCENYYQEASIIQKLESLGIGRPSTYSMLVDTIQQRKYVLKQNIDGQEYQGNEFILNDNGIQSLPVCKIFGASKNKLKIQDLGIQAVELLYHYFQPLFDYSYTSQMESELDMFVTDHEKRIEDVCSNCEQIINTCLKPLKDKLKQSYPIDNEHELVFGKSGMMIKVISESTDKKPVYKSLKPNLELDFEKLEKKEYHIEDLVEIKDDTLGIFENETMYLKNGPYGPYLTWGSNKLSIGNYTKKTALKDVNMAFAIECIEKDREKGQDKHILRHVNENITVRTGKYGPYIFYKTNEMKKPKFINLKKCPHNALEESVELLVEWVRTTQK